MKCSLVCIGSLYVALLSLNKSLQSKPHFVRIDATYFTYHDLDRSLLGANKVCDNIANGDLLNITQLRRDVVVDFIKDLWVKPSLPWRKNEQWIWTSEECGMTACNQSVNWTDGYPPTPSGNKRTLIFDAQSGKYKNHFDHNIYMDLKEPIVEQFVCMYTESNIIQGSGVANTTNGLCFKHGNSNNFSCICHSGTACSGKTCTSSAEIQGSCCAIASSCTTSQISTASTTTSHAVTFASSQAPAADGITTPHAITDNAIAAATEASEVTSTSSSGGSPMVGIIIGVSIAISLIAFVAYIVYNRKLKARLLRHRQQRQAAARQAAAVPSGASGSSEYEFSPIINMGKNSMGKLGSGVKRWNKAPSGSLRHSAESISSSVSVGSDMSLSSL